MDYKKIESAAKNAIVRDERSSGKALSVDDKIAVAIAAALKEYDSQNNPEPIVTMDQR